MSDQTQSKQGRPRPFVRWLRAPARFGPWPLWAWGVKVGWAFDLGPLRVGWMRKQEGRA
jgi:hypothetical protein